MKRSSSDDVLYIIKQYFTFSRSERRGFFLLSGLIVLLLLSLYFINFLPGPEPVDFSSFKKDIEEFEKQLAMNNQKEKDNKEEKNYTKENINILPGKKESVTLFAFNPNNLPEEKWKSLGLTEKQIHTIKNYESKGGKFYKKEDVKKIFGISPQLYAQLEPYIKIPPREKEFFKKDSSENKGHFRQTKKENVTVEINSATAEDFQKLNGIGPAKSNNIITYRNRLGGFVSINQVSEAYGIDSLLFQSIKNQLQIRFLNISRLNINTSDPGELKHPYISLSLARLITNYRKVHGNYQNIEEIKKLALVNEETYRKIAPYLTTE